MTVTHSYLFEVFEVRVPEYSSHVVSEEDRSSGPFVVGEEKTHNFV